jgi:hypothetical protein
MCFVGSRDRLGASFFVLSRTQTARHGFVSSLPAESLFSLRLDWFGIRDSGTTYVLSTMTISRDRDSTAPYPNPAATVLAHRLMTPRVALGHRMITF